MARTPQAEVIHLDTHVVCWLYEGRTDLLSASAVNALEHGQLLVSPMVDLELQLLYEIGRIRKGSQVVLAALAREIGLDVTAPSLPRVVATARALSWARDPFDRLIVAEALLTGAALITKDRWIRRHCAAVLW